MNFHGFLVIMGALELVSGFVLPPPLNYYEPISTSWPYDDGSDNSEEWSSADFFATFMPGHYSHSQNHRKNPHWFRSGGDDEVQNAEDSVTEVESGRTERVTRSCSTKTFNDMFANSCFKNFKRNAASLPILMNVIVVEYYYPPQQSSSNPFHFPADDDKTMIIQQKIAKFPVFLPQESLQGLLPPGILDQHHSEGHGAGVILIVEQVYGNSNVGGDGHGQPVNTLMDQLLLRELPRRDSMEEALRTFKKCCYGGCREKDFMHLCYY